MIPAIPQKEAGLVTEPPVWLPKARGHILAATAAADPLLKPPGVCWVFQGFLVGAGSRKANAVVSVLPMMIAPTSLSLVTIDASVLGTNSWIILYLSLL